MPLHTLFDYVLAVIAIIGAGFTVLATACGAAWWMSSLYAAVQGCSQQLAGLREDMRTDKAAIHGTLKEYGDKLVDLDVRNDRC